jgi:hypothetical protein
VHLVSRADMIARIDATLDDASPINRPTPVLRGTIEEFENWASQGATLVRHTTPGGVSTLRNIPTRLLTYRVRAAFYMLFAELEQAETTQTAPVV